MRVTYRLLESNAGPSNQRDCYFQPTPVPEGLWDTEGRS